MAITAIHDELYEFLIQKNREQHGLFFRPRKTNRSNKLTDGYWFLGNDDYLTVGFWKGVNWITKAPNIAFVISSNGDSWLHINTSDSEEKTSFVEKHLREQLGLSPSSPSYIKKYKGKNWKDNISDFLYFDWFLIDNAIKDFYFTSKSESKLPIGLIDSFEFHIDIEKINFYREEKRNFDEDFSIIEPCKIQNFEINNYGPIKHCTLKNIPSKAQWVFLTGENGVGKTSILKALATSIGHRKMTEMEARENKGFNVELDLIGKNNAQIKFIRKNNEGTSKRKPNSIGFAAYGAMRLKTIYGGLTDNQIKNAKSKSGTFKSLFNNDGYLLDLESEFKNWQAIGIDISKRESEIKEILESIMLNVGEVGFRYKSGKTPITLFSEIDSDGKLLPTVTIDKLSSGYLSIVSMMSDMIIRLYQQQPEIKDIADLKGVVIIDEIDIHLHPKFQKHFVEQLTAAFPNVQFIVSTHSPLPLLGAPRNSVICVVKRNSKNGVVINRIDDKIYFQDLLPNTLLTSPIFGMDDITNYDRNESIMIRTEKSYKELEFVDKLELKINEFMTDEKEQQLIELFEDRRK
jgi:predicted ATPase